MPSPLCDFAPLRELFSARTLLLLIVPFTLAADRPDEAFFETRIRPVLAEHCYRCHSAEAKTSGKLKGGLVLDSREGILQGGDSGPALVPHKPAGSLLLKALRHTDDTLRMPPKAPLPATVVADFEQWIARGASVPTIVHRASLPQRPTQEHWSFQPIRDVPLPAVKQTAWPQSPVDRFILAKLEAKGLTPSSPAERRTLLRRVTFDLIGLPPTPAEMDAFLADSSAEAFARVVDRLLASPHYGERWGRHWLDVARYADTKDGVLMFGDRRVRPYAYTYRDYVIRALNEDLPFDRFVHEQLAADLIEPAVEPWRLAAMGFLTLGRMFDNNIQDVIDDRIDTVTRGLLGLTVSCARCHDHKYDPIPTADYYSLHGIFASCEQPLLPPLTERPENIPGYAEFEKQLAPKRDAVQRILDTQYALLSETARRRVPDYLVHVVTTPPDPLETAIYFLSLAPEDLRPPIIARWRAYLERRVRPDDPVFGPWHDLVALPDADFTFEAPEVVERWRKRDPDAVNPLVIAALTSTVLTNKADVARTYGELLWRVFAETKAGPLVGDDPRQPLLEVLASPSSPAYFPKNQTRHYMSRADKDGFAGKVLELDLLAVQARNAPPRAPVLNDAPILYEPHVFVRGNPARPGAAVPRQFLAVIEGERRKPFAHGSGRLDLAHAITAATNPLTSRVLVNRIWMHHFGEPLVDTPSDFGTRSQPPTHPELLDYLAGWLQREGWSLKKLHRLLLLSSTYQQASSDRPECHGVDADNRLLWRMNRRRLDLEAMRDGLLAVAGRLDDRLGGRPVDIASDPRQRRRTVYGLVDRQSLPGLFRAFDFASPDQSAERRTQTTVPQQALFGMNSLFVLEQARSLAGRLDGEPGRRVEQLYGLVLGRKPDAEELRLAREFIAATATTPWEEYAQVLLLTNEFLFVD